MSLSAREQEALGCIESELARSDPKLASLLATFARLTSGEEMPVREKIQAVRRWSAFGARRVGQRLGDWRSMALLWLIIAFALVAVALVVGNGGGSGSKGSCANWWSTTCTAPATTHPTRSA